MSALTTRTRAWFLSTRACLCLAEIWIAGLGYSGHQVLAGRHGWFPDVWARRLRATHTRRTP